MMFSSIWRGIKNVFRSPVKTGGIALILGLSITVALVMLMTNQIVGDRISDVKSQIGNTVSVTPVGIRGFEGGGEPLAEKYVNELSDLEHVLSTSSSLNGQPTSTDLESAIDAGSFGERFGGRIIPGGPGGNFTRGVSLNVTGIDLTGSLPLSFTNSPSLTDGRYFEESDAKKYVAIVGKDLAEKNDLKIGSTFEMDEYDFKVVGIFDTGTEFGNNALYIPLKTAQTVFDLSGVTEITLTVDSIENVDTVITTAQGLLGEEAEVSSESDRFEGTLSSLGSIAQTTQVALFGSFGAAVVIIFFAMLVTVRGRMKEIGVLKAIGAGNLNLIFQFGSETITLSLLAAFLASILSYFSGNAIVQSFVQSSGPTTTGGPGGGAALGRGLSQVFLGDLSNLQVFNLQTIGYALLFALAIGILGSIVPIILAVRLRPVEVMKIE